MQKGKEKDGRELRLLIRVRKNGGDGVFASRTIWIINRIMARVRFDAGRRPPRLKTW